MGKYAEKYDGLDSVLSVALIEVFDIVGMKFGELASILDVHVTTIHNVIGNKRSYAPPLPMVEDMLKVFEARKPGARSYYGLRIAGLTKTIAEKKAFGQACTEVDEAELSLDKNLDIKLSDRAKKAMRVADLEVLVNDLDESVASRLLIAGLNRLFMKVDEAEGSNTMGNISLPIAFRLFSFCYGKPGFSEYIETQDIPLTLAESLVFTGLKMGARPEKIGAGLSHQEFGGLILGFTPNLTSPSDLQKTDAISLEAKSYRKNTSRMKKSIRKSKK